MGKSILNLIQIDLGKHYGRKKRRNQGQNETLNKAATKIK